MKKTLLVSFLFAFLFALSASAQSPYQLSNGRDIAMLGGSGALWASAHWLSSDNTPLTADEISLLDKDELLGFQRWVVTQNSDRAEAWSNYLLNYSQALPALFLVEKQGRKDWYKLAVMYGETTLFTRGLTLMTKNVVRRRRPFVYNDAIPIEEKLSVSAKQSFFSGHTSKTAAMCFFTAKVYADYHPDSEWRPVIWTAAATIPAVTGYLRMAKGRHFFLDVMTGYLVGGSIGYLVPHFHNVNRKKEDGSGLRVYGGANGVLVQYRF